MFYLSRFVWVIATHRGRFGHMNGPEKFVVVHREWD